MMGLKTLWNDCPAVSAYFHRDVTVHPYPHVFNVEHTFHCPMDCIMCPRKRMSREQGFMDPTLFDRIIDQAAGYTRWIWLHHFGESCLHPDLGRMIVSARENGVRTRLSANATVLTKTVVDSLCATGLNRLHISLDGTSSEMYKRISGENAYYEKALENIEYIREKKETEKKDRPHVSVAIIRMRYTETEVETFKRLWRVPGVDEVVIKPFTFFAEDIRAMEDLVDDVHIQANVHCPTKHPCFYPWWSVSILWDGRVVPCCYDFDAKYVLGDIRDEDLYGIWNNDRMTTLRVRHISNDLVGIPLCATCRERRGGPSSRIYPFNLPIPPALFKDIWKGLQGPS